MIVFIKLNIRLPYEWANPFLGIYPRETNTSIHPKICAQIITTASFISAQTRNNPNVPSQANEQTSHSMACPATKREDYWQIQHEHASKAFQHLKRLHTTHRHLTTPSKSETTVTETSGFQGLGLGRGNDYKAEVYKSKHFPQWAR